MLNFKVNKYITLRLECKTTNIYVNGEKFDQCKYILIKTDIGALQDNLKKDSIDEMAENLNHMFEGIETKSKKIDPETEFWVHSSNLQVWVENEYDTRLIHSNLAFPLLKKLTEIGDLTARKVFKEEIAKRLESGYPPVNLYLLSEGYLEYLNKEEKEIVFQKLHIKLSEILKRNNLTKHSDIINGILRSLINTYKDVKTKLFLKNLILNSMRNGEYVKLDFYINELGLVDFFNTRELKALLFKSRFTEICKTDKQIKYLFNEVLKMLENIQSLDKYKHISDEYKEYKITSFLIYILGAVNYPYPIKKIEVILKERLLYSKEIEL